MADDGPKRKPDKPEGSPAAKRVRKGVSDEQLFRTLKVAFQRLAETRGSGDDREEPDRATWAQLIPQKCGAPTLEVKGPTFFLGLKNNAVASSSTAAATREKLVAKFARGSPPMVEALSSTSELYVNQRLVAKGASAPLRSGDELHISSNHRFHSYMFSLHSDAPTAGGNTAPPLAASAPAIPDPIGPPIVREEGQSLPEDDPKSPTAQATALETMEEDSPTSEVAEDEVAQSLDMNGDGADPNPMPGAPPEGDPEAASPTPPLPVDHGDLPDALKRISSCSHTYLQDPEAADRPLSPPVLPAPPLTPPPSLPAPPPAASSPVPRLPSSPAPAAGPLPPTGPVTPEPLRRTVSAAVQTDPLPEDTEPDAATCSTPVNQPCVLTDPRVRPIDSGDHAPPDHRHRSSGPRSFRPRGPPDWGRRERARSPPLVMSEVVLPPVPSLPSSLSEAPTVPDARPGSLTMSPTNLPLPPLTISHWKDKVVRELSTQVLKAEDVLTSIDPPSEFPYHLAEATRQVLLHTLFVPLKRPELLRFSPTDASHPNLNRNLLLTGPPGSEVYQEVLARSLAAKFGAFFLPVDRLVPRPPNQPVPAPSRPQRPLQRGDRVVYAPCSFGAAHPSAAGMRSLLSSSVPPYAPASGRGPPIGAAGQVVLAFEDNPQRQKVGVAFDQPVPGGCDLGGLCPPEHGYFAAVNDVMLENEQTSGQTIAIQALFEVVALHQPCVVFLRDAESVCFGNAERFLAFRKLMEQLTSPAVFIARSIKQESQKPPAKVTVTLRSCSSSESPFSPPFPFEQLGLSDLPTFLLGSGSGSGPPFPPGDEMPTSVKLIGARRAVDASRPPARVMQKLFPISIAVSPLPEDVDRLPAPDVQRWKERLAQDASSMKQLAAAKALKRSLEEGNVACAPLLDALAQCHCNDPPGVIAKFAALGLAEALEQATVTPETGRQVVQWAVAHQLQASPAVQFSPSDRKLVLQPASLLQGLQLHLKTESGNKVTNKLREAMQTDNEFEKRLLGEVVQPAQINVRFDQIGSHETVKQLLREVVLLPLTRPSLFKRGALLRPCKGILLFGPPGTGKTMLAKAIATEAKAHFINITMGVVTSKWFGEAEKLVAAVFSLARKLQPCIVFIDEVDAMLGRRSADQEHETMRKLKNEFMAAWDGLKSQDFEQVMVLAATNRPADLDDAVLRRMPRAGREPRTAHDVGLMGVDPWGLDPHHLLLPIPILFNSPRGGGGSGPEVWVWLWREVAMFFGNALRRSNFLALSPSSRGACTEPGGWGPILPQGLKEKPASRPAVQTPRRILVDVPNEENRRKILAVILREEALAPDVDLSAVAKMTAGYSGSDLKQLCVAAAYRPVREFLQAEANAGEPANPERQAAEDPAVALRPIGLEDFQQACKEVGGSVNEESAAIAELRKWNAAYGDGGNREQREQLSYFM